MRIAIGGILHETATFVAGRTTLQDFERGFGLYRGDEVLQRFTGANMCPGGFIEAGEVHGFEVVPLLWTFAYPSGLIDRAAYDALKAEFLERLKQAEAGGRIDGVLLDLHGAMVVDGLPDADGDMIASVRAAIGPDRPLMVTTDLHSNHTPLRVQNADAICGYDTYPHVDMAARGREAGDLIVRTLRGEVRPRMAIKQIPMFWSVKGQVTGHAPMNEVIRRVHEIESRPGLLSCTIATCFPWADVPDVGASVMVVADGDTARAQAAADELADWVWRERKTWQAPPVKVRDAIAAGEALGKFPIMLADHADNTGGGSPGDSTEILRAFHDLKLQDALLLYLVDLDAVAAAHAAGVGKTIHLALGGRSDPVQGPPLEVDVEVVALTEGKFAYDGPMYAGLTGNMGRSAWLRFGREAGGGGVSVVVVTAREQPLDQAFARSLGIDCSKMKYIAVKSAAHFRSGFEKIAGSIHNVDARAILTHDWGTLPYKLRKREIYPLEIRD
jgi:microcystin degradation protein MlrC